MQNQIASTIGRSFINRKFLMLVCLLSCFFCLSGGALANDAKKRIEALTKALTLVCLPSQFTGEAVENIVGDQGALAKMTPPIRSPRLPPPNERLMLQGREGKAFIWGPTEGYGVVIAETSGACSIKARGVDGLAIADEWASWLVGDGAPFKLVKEEKLENFLTRLYVANLGSKSVIAIVSYRNPKSSAGSADVMAMVSVFTK